MLVDGLRSDFISQVAWGLVKGSWGFKLGGLGGASLGGLAKGLRQQFRVFGEGLLALSLSPSTGLEPAGR